MARNHVLFYRMATAAVAATEATNGDDEDNVIAQIEAFITAFKSLVASGEVDEGLNDLIAVINARVATVSGAVNVEIAKNKTAKKGSSAAKSEVATHTVVGVPALKGALVVLVTTEPDKDGKVQVRLTEKCGERAAGKVLRMPVKVVRKISAPEATESGSSAAKTPAKRVSKPATPAKRAPRKQTSTAAKGTK